MTDAVKNARRDGVTHPASSHNSRIKVFTAPFKAVNVKRARNADFQRRRDFTARKARLSLVDHRLWLS